MNSLDETLQYYIGKEVRYKGIDYTIEDIRNTSTGVKMIFMKDLNEQYFEPSLSLFIDEVIRLRK